jgi:hypothetical protein
VRFGGQRAVGPALGHEGEYPTLLSGERGERIPLPLAVHQPGNEFGVDDAVTGDDATDVGGERRQVADAVLEQADAVAASRRRRGVYPTNVSAVVPNVTATGPSAAVQVSYTAAGAGAGFLKMSPSPPGWSPTPPASTPAAQAPT